MERYEVKGKGIATGRKRKRVYSASSEEEARKKAEADGTLIEEIVKLPPKPATENQLAFAKEHGIFIPDGATLVDASCLISLYLDGDTPSTVKQRKYAEDEFGIKISDYIGEDLLLENIINTKINQDDYGGQVIWFVFSVYCEISDTLNGIRITVPSDPIIQKVAEKITTNEKAMTSIRRNGYTIEWAKENRISNKSGLKGSIWSKRTIAFREVELLLQKEINKSPSFHQRKTNKHHSLQNKNNKPSPFSLLSSFFLLFIGAILFSLLLSKI